MATIKTMPATVHPTISPTSGLLDTCLLLIFGLNISVKAVVSLKRKEIFIKLKSPWVGAGDCEAEGDWEGVARGLSVGVGNGDSVGDSDGDSVGDSETEGVGESDGDCVGVSVTDGIGESEGVGSGDSVAVGVGVSVIDGVGDSEAVAVGVMIFIPSVSVWVTEIEVDITPSVCM